ncbi:uncharacterized protein [Triticum aestivum]|uniref:DUF7851 domain-containing protein n=1 Tax=Triticum turgidum subsp. durum TaxID=4567 RepID=A0A9R0QAP6_TRITD|nr:uncharacterized protein LOC123058981 isoform X2 [Triticum aestivum]VAH08092.1 unnamed protein product [Triticum turgidum subsp. durum]
MLSWLFNFYMQPCPKGCFNAPVVPNSEGQNILAPVLPIGHIASRAFAFAVAVTGKEQRKFEPDLLRIVAASPRGIIGFLQDQLLAAAAGGGTAKGREVAVGLLITAFSPAAQLTPAAAATAGKAKQRSGTPAIAMAEEKKKHKHSKHKEKDKEKKDKAGGAAAAAEASFKPCGDVKGIRFGGQFIVKSFTVRRASPLELLRLLDIPPSFLSELQSLPFPSTTAYMPTSFTILAHQAWHTLTLGLGTKKSKVVLFVFESEAMKAAVDQLWPAMIPLGDVNKKLIRGLSGSEMARFKFRKGCLTIYVYAVRRLGAAGFVRADDLRRILQAVVELKDFLDHTAMLAMPSQRSITLQSRGTVAQ